MSRSSSGRRMRWVRSRSWTGCITAATTWRMCATSLKVPRDRKSTRLNSSHLVISYAVFCLKKKKDKQEKHPKAHNDTTDPQQSYTSYTNHQNGKHPSQKINASARFHTKHARHTTRSKSHYL